MVEGGAYTGCYPIKDGYASLRPHSWSRSQMVHRSAPRKPPDVNNSALVMDSWMRFVHRENEGYLAKGTRKCQAQKSFRDSPFTVWLGL
jgi:hypothetical protein